MQGPNVKGAQRIGCAQVDLDGDPLAACPFAVGATLPVAAGVAIKEHLAISAGFDRLCIGGKFTIGHKRDLHGGGFNAQVCRKGIIGLSRFDVV